MGSRVLVMIVIAGLLASCSGETKRRSETVGDDVSSAVPDSTKAKLDIVLATVGDEQITFGDLRAHMLKRSNPETVDRHMSNPDIFHAALSSLIDQFVWERAARKAGTKLDRDEYMQIRSLETQLYANHYMLDVIEPLAKPTDEQIQDYYNQHIEQFRVPARVAARHIQVATREDAERLKKEAEGGADFAALARQYSLDTNTKDLGGALGWVQVGSPVLGIGEDPRFISSVLLMDQGELAVVQSAKGWHLVKAEKKEGGGPQPLSEVREAIVNTLTPRNFGRIYNDLLDKERQKVNVHYDTKNIEEVTGVKDSPGRLWDNYNRQQDPLGKIEMLRRLAYDYSDDPRAPEAQFMMAYISLTEVKDRKAAKDALDRLDARFPKSRWRRAGDYLRQNLDVDNPASLGTPAEILKKSGQ